jgi:hypothetical protein
LPYVARDSRQVMMSLIPTSASTTADRRIGVGWLYKSLFNDGLENEHTALADSKATLRFAVPIMRSGRLG